MSAFSRLKSGHAWALAAVFFWGAMFPVGRFLMERGAMEPSTLAMARYLLATPALMLVGCAVHGRAMFPVRPSDWVHMAVLGLVGSSAMALLLFMAQRQIAAVNASLLEAYVPIQVMLLEVLGGRRAGLRQWLSVIAGFVGSMLVLRALDGSGVALGRLQTGDLLIFLSGLCWSLYTYLGNGLVRRLGGLCFTAWTVFFGGVWLLLYNLATGTSMRMPSAVADWGCVVFLALCPTAISFFGWNQAQRTISLSTLSFMEYFTPMVAAAVGIAFLGEAITAWQWLGMAIIIFSAALQTAGDK